MKWMNKLINNVIIDLKIEGIDTESFPIARPNTYGDMEGHSNCGKIAHNLEFEGP